MERQESYRRSYGRRTPGWRDSLAVYWEAVDAAVAPHAHVLDLGCGHSDVLADVFAKTPFTYGVDPDHDALRQNRVVRHRIAGVGDRLPFADERFDAVVAAWVVEHLGDPARAVREVHRVLRPGGRFVFLTPNALHPATWPIRVVPNRLHAPIVHRLYGRPERDTFSVHYRMNTPRAIERTLRLLGFERDRLILNGDPSYLSFGPVSFCLACGFEGLIERRWSGAKVHIIGVYVKAR